MGRWLDEGKDVWRAGNWGMNGKMDGGKGPDGGMCGRLGEEMAEWINGGMDKRWNGEISEGMNGRASGHLNERMGGETDGEMGECLCEGIGGGMDRGMCGYFGGGR